jgi:hypothetical protein
MDSENIARPCEIRIVPKKEKNRAEVNLVLLTSAWNEINRVSLHILREIPDGALLKSEIFRNNTLYLEVRYDFLESVTRSVEAILAAYPEMEIRQKQIFIKKLGGWFDF